MTHNKSFGLGLTDINEVRNIIGYTIDDIFVIFYLSVLRIEALTGPKNMTR